MVERHTAELGRQDAPQRRQSKLIEELVWSWFHGITVDNLNELVKARGAQTENARSQPEGGCAR